MSQSERTGDKYRGRTSPVPCISYLAFSLWNDEMRRGGTGDGNARSTSGRE